MVGRWLTAYGRDVTGWAGVGLVTYGAALIYPPAGYVVPGLFLLASALLWRTR